MATSYNTYDRYSKFRENGEVKLVPFVEVPKNSTDVYVTYELGKTRLDSVSYYYYSNPHYGWLILQANPQYGSLEFQKFIMNTITGVLMKSEISSYFTICSPDREIELC